MKVAYIPYCVRHKLSNNQEHYIHISFLLAVCVSEMCINNVWTCNTGSQWKEPLHVLCWRYDYLKTSATLGAPTEFISILKLNVTIMIACHHPGDEPV